MKAKFYVDIEGTQEQIDALVKELAATMKLESITEEAPPAMADSLKDDIGLCAAAVVLAYYRKTHEHIIADDDTLMAALRVEKYLGRR